MAQILTPKLQGLATCIPGLLLSVVDQVKQTRMDFLYERGTADRLYAEGFYERPTVFRLIAKHRLDQVDISLCSSQAPGSRSYVNLLPTVSGSHVTGISRALKELGQNRQLVENLKLCGVCLPSPAVLQTCVSAYVNEPKYSYGRSILCTPAIEELVYNTIITKLVPDLLKPGTWYCDYPSLVHWSDTGGANIQLRWLAGKLSQAFHINIAGVDPVQVHLRIDGSGIIPDKIEGAAPGLIGKSFIFATATVSIAGAYDKPRPADVIRDQLADKVEQAVFECIALLRDSQVAEYVPTLKLKAHRALQKFRKMNPELPSGFRKYLGS